MFNYCLMACNRQGLLGGVVSNVSLYVLRMASTWVCNAAVYILIPTMDPTLTRENECPKP